MHPDVDAAVFETARGGILREGLGFDRCQVAVVTNIGAGDHLGLNYITTVEDLAVLKRVIVRTWRPRATAVLNATDPIVVAMANHCPGSVIYFALDRTTRCSTHRAQGKRVVYVGWRRHRRGEGQLARAAHAAARHPITRNGTIGFQIENAMAAVAAAWALGLDWDASAPAGQLRQRRRQPRPAAST
jgi:cyanophycin synthetase